MAHVDMPTQVAYPTWTTIKIRPYRCLLYVPAMEFATPGCEHVWPLVSCDPSHSPMDVTDVTCAMGCAWYLVWSGMCYVTWMGITLGHMCMRVWWIMVQDGELCMPHTVLRPLCVCLIILVPGVCQYFFQWIWYKVTWLVRAWCDKHNAAQAVRQWSACMPHLAVTPPKPIPIARFMGKVRLPSIRRQRLPPPHSSHPTQSPAHDSMVCDPTRVHS
eukprot:1708899-Amphidinium_carterae.1